MTNVVIVLCWETPTPSEVNAQKIAEFLGANVRLISLTAPALRSVDSIGRLVPSCACLVTHVETLVHVADTVGTGINGLGGLIDLSKHVFIYGFQPTARHSAVLRILSSGDLVGLLPADAAGTTFHVSTDYRDWCGQFSGLSFNTTDARNHASFVEGVEQRRQVTLIRAAGKPFFVRVDHGPADLFFVACGELADLDEKITDGASLLPWFSRLAPFMMFLRGALGKHLWHNDHPRACFIIDDALLRDRYGFLEYRKLVETSRRQRFSTSIAFIPWNYRRSHKKTATLFAANPRGLSLCVHGCDHTRAEFGTTSFESLCGSAELALDRMREHSRRSGIPFDDVMVFPQGIFSSVALEALRACGYLAAVNTDLCPSDLPGALSLRDLLEVAITRFAGVPLFGRRYPKEPAEFAFDLFLGKPALVVEHHEYFRDGYDGLAAFVANLNALDARLEWTNLATICASAYMTRTAENGDVHVRFYTDGFGMRNSGSHAQEYLLIRQHPPAEPPASVRLNARNWDFRREDDSLKISLSLEPGQTADVRILAKTADVRRPRQRAVVHKVRVLVRRLLSEVRVELSARR